jgi:hypothetical protein
MGEVYQAKDTRLGRDVAIKILPESFAEDSDRRARFEREAQAIAALSHPNVVAIFDTGMHDRQAYVVMELLTGQTLRERLAGSSRQSGTAPEGVPEVCRRQHTKRCAGPSRACGPHHGDPHAAEGAQAGRSPWRRRRLALYMARRRSRVRLFVRANAVPVVLCLRSRALAARSCYVIDDSTTSLAVRPAHERTSS